VGRRINPEHDTDLLLVDLNALDECPNDLSTSQPIGFMQSGLHSCGKLVEPTQDQRQCSLQTGFVSYLLGMCFHMLHPFSHACHPGLKLRFVNQSLGITINQACHPLSQPSHPCLEAGAFIRRLLVLEQASAILLLKPFWVREQPTDFFPYGFIDQIRSQLLVPAQPHPTEAIGI